MKSSSFIPYFQDKAVWDHFLTVVESWLGTPYRHVTVVKGRGADCALFIGACWLESGVLQRLSYDYYPKDWYRHSDDERVLESLYRHFREHAAPGLGIQRLDPSAEVMRGDALSLSIGCGGRVSNHTALYVGGGEVVHASPKKGVTKARYAHWLKPGVTNIFRVVRSA